MIYERKPLRCPDGPGAAEATPPVAKMLEKGVKVSAGTDATRVASYNPWISLAWRVTGKTVGSLRIYPQRNRLDRETALRMWTESVTWFSNEVGKKDRIAVGQLADLIVPDRDYFACSDEDIADTTADLTMVGGKFVYGAGDFARFDETRRRPQYPTGRRTAGSVAMLLGASREAPARRRFCRRWSRPAAVPTSSPSMAMTMRRRGRASYRSPTSNPSGARSGVRAGRFSHPIGAAFCRHKVETC
jgi:Amidohydrolase family